MKHISFLALISLMALSMGFVLFSPSTAIELQDHSAENAVKGAWLLVEYDGIPIPKNEGMRQIKTLSDGYFMFSRYDLQNKQFEGTGGGTYSFSDGVYTENIEFHTFDSELVGTRIEMKSEIKADKWYVHVIYEGEQSVEVYERIDTGMDSPLSGAWRITQRANREGQMSAMRMGPRKTIKLLTDTRFQWTAYNVETKDFRGTGGGTYTFKDGKYTETIEFFSRDSSRVGAQLSFDGSVEGKDWHHSGLSSKGAPISEIWSKQD